MYFEIDIDDVRDSLDEIAVIDNGVSFYNYDAHCWVSDLGVTDKMINTSRIALEKQLPKKPKVCDFPEYPTKIGVCIVCGEQVNGDMKYCDQCGQKLDWGE